MVHYSSRVTSNFLCKLTKNFTKTHNCTTNTQSCTLQDSTKTSATPFYTL